MGSLGSADFKELKEFQKKLQQLGDDRAEFCEKCSKQLAGRLLAEAVKHTPTGQKPKIKDVIGEEKNEKAKAKKLEAYHNIWEGYVGGNLRRNWTGGKEVNPLVYANSLPVYKNGSNYTIVVENTTKKYASYVEFGHRQTPGRYVPAIGKSLTENYTQHKYMLTNAELLIRSKAPAILDRELNKFFTEVFDG